MHLSLLTLLLFSACLCAVSVLLGVGIAAAVNRGASSRRTEELIDEKRVLERKLAGLKETVVALQGEIHEARVTLPGKLNQLRQERDQHAVQLKRFEENYRTLAQQSRALNETCLQGQHEYQNLKRTYNEHVSQLQQMNRALQARLDEAARVSQAPVEPAETTILRSFPAPHVN